MRSSERQRLKREIRSVTESALGSGGGGDNNVTVSVSVSEAACEHPPVDPIPKAKRSKRRDRKRLNPNLIVDRLFRLCIFVLFLAFFAYAIRAV